MELDDDRKTPKQVISHLPVILDTSHAFKSTAKHLLALGLRRCDLRLVQVFHALVVAADQLHCILPLLAPPVKTAGKITMLNDPAFSTRFSADTHSRIAVDVLS